MGKRILLGALICGLLLFFSVGAFAQESAVKGNLGGVVVDSTGAVIPGAKVTLTAPTGTATVNSDNEGNFMFTRLAPGLYAVKVEKQGFKAADVKGVEVAIGRTSSLKMQLEPGATTETIEVSANAVTVDTSSTASGSDLSDTFYSKVPTPRNVSGLFYVAPGVADSGGAGRANPSISGGSGLENLYVADGVNITDAAFGGLGVFTRNQGSVGTGINLSFIKEVQVKTGGFEPQYGQATGGVVQIVTKSGGKAFHGAIAAYAAPRGAATVPLQTDNFRVNKSGTLDNPSNYDVSGELGGYIPGFKDHLFFFGAYNPSWTFNYATPPPITDTVSQTPVGLFALSGGKPFVLRTFVNNYAGKLTYKLNDRHSIESSVFGDPSRNNQGPENLVLTAENNGGFSKWDYGTRNWVVRYNGTLSPTWLVNSSFTWNNNRFTETPLFDVYSVTDLSSGAPNSLQGFGFKENHDANDFAYTIDTSKVVNKFGNHTFTLGFNNQFLNYDNNRRRSGPGYAPPSTNAVGASVPYGLCPGASCPLNPGTITDASFTLIDASTLGCTLCPIFNGVPVALDQIRGQTGGNLTPTEGLYYAGYGNDTWQINKFVTISMGLRWEQYTMRGTAAKYTFTDNWAPRLGVVIDPKGDRRSKFYANFGRYNYQMPLDAAIRSLSSETDLSGMFFAPGADGANNVIQNPDGSINVITDAAHLLNNVPGGIAKNPIVSQSGAGEAFSPGTKMQYEDEWIAGYERDFGHGVIVSARYVDRRLRRVVEDMSGISPEGANALLLQQFSIGNPGPNTDLFHNLHEQVFTGSTAPCQTVAGIAPLVVPGPITDANGNVVSNSSICFEADPNHLSSDPSTVFGGDVGPDGTPDGFATPVRNYQAVEVEVNKGFSNGWLMRANYRVARLRGNYEGAFRNDNGQTDPSISSLFDFTTGLLNELGDQFAVGPLNTDRRHVVNGFFSYTLPRTALKNLTLGTGIRVQGGTPISELADHPVYQNSGEVPIGGRGALGRTPVTGQVDLHADYPWKFGERQTFRFAIDLFNVSNSKPVLAVDQTRDLSGGLAFSNPDFLKPGSPTANIFAGFQNPFRARFSLRWEF